MIIERIRRRGDLAARPACSSGVEQNEACCIALPLSGASLKCKTLSDSQGGFILGSNGRFPPVGAQSCCAKNGGRNQTRHSNMIQPRRTHAVGFPPRKPQNTRMNPRLPIPLFVSRFLPGSRVVASEAASAVRFAAQARLPIVGGVWRALCWPAEWHGHLARGRAPRHMGETSLRPGASAGRLPMPLAPPSIGR